MAAQKIRRYSELRSLKTFKERYEYLKLHGTVGLATFGSDRYLNQMFYHSSDWLSVRDYVIIRDNGCDLGIDQYEIRDKIIIHHMNPILVEDFDSDIENLLNPEFLISTSLGTHNAIHYGDDKKLPYVFVDRAPNDTTLWKRGDTWKAFFNR